MDQRAVAVLLTASRGEEVEILGLPNGDEQMESDASRTVASLGVARSLNDAEGAGAMSTAAAEQLAAAVSGTSTVLDILEIFRDSTGWGE